MAELTEQDWYLRYKADQGIRRIGREKDSVYLERMEYELRVIIKLGYSPYFLVLEDCLGWARAQGMRLGYGRGSAAGSLVSYLLQITKIDPIKCGLFFERFLNEGRISAPDVDSDIDYRRRGELVDYLRDKYGHDKVVRIGTTGTMKARMAVRDTARTLGIDPLTIDTYGKLVPVEDKGGQGDHAVLLKDCLNPTKEFRDEHKDDIDKFLRAYDTDKVFHEVVNRALEIQGLPKSDGVHAAGLVIWDQPIDTLVPLSQTKDGAAVTQWCDKEVESIKLVKYDFLGLKTLNVVGDAEDTIAKRTGIKIDWDSVEEDPMTYELLQKGDCYGVFQLTESGMSKFTAEFGPESIYDISIISAMYRPGPLALGYCKDIVKIRDGLQTPSYPIEALRKILEPTSGLMCFQEQVLEIAKVVAGYSLSEADLLRRAIGKKLPLEMAAQRQSFIKGCLAYGLKIDVATKLFDDIEGFADYSFPLAHAYAYSVLSFQTAYLKAHYPADFYAANMSNEDELKKVVPFIVDARSHSVRVLSPDINESGNEFLPIDSMTVRFGLGAVRDCGDSAIEEIRSKRLLGPFTSLLDFCQRVSPTVVRKNNIVALIQAGAFDVIEPDLNRFEMVGYLDSLVEGLKHGREAEKKNQLTMFGDLFSDPNKGLVFKKPKIALDKKLMLAEEKHVLGLYISDSPLSAFRHIEQYTHIDRLMDVDMADLRVRCLVMVTELIVRNAKNGEFAVLTLEDETGVMPAKMWNNVYSKYRGLLTEGQCLVISGKTNTYRGLEINIDSVVLAETELTSLNRSEVLSELTFEDILRLSTSRTGKVPVDLEVGDLRYRLGFINS